MLDKLIKKRSNYINTNTITINLKNWSKSYTLVNDALFFLYLKYAKLSHL